MWPQNKIYAHSQEIMLLKKEGRKHIKIKIL